MRKARSIGALSATLLLASALLVFAACGGGGAATSAPVATAPTSAPERVAAEAAPPAPTARPTPTAAPAAVAVPAPTAMPVATPEPAATAVPESVPSATPEPEPEPRPTPTPTPTPVPAPAATAVPDSVPSPTPAPEPEPTPAPTPVLVSTVDEYGFSLRLDQGTDVRAAGWTGPEPDSRQGSLSFDTGVVTAILVWSPQEGRQPLTFLADTYNVLRASQPGLTLDPISDGEIDVGGEQGVFGGFKTVDSSGGALGGGLIGAWVCPEPGTAFRLTLTGEDSTVVQLRFDRLLDNFTCSS